MYSPLQFSNPAITESPGTGSIVQCTAGSVSDAINSSLSATATLSWQVFDANKDLVASGTTQPGPGNAFDFTPATNGTYTVSLVANDADATSPAATFSSLVTINPVTVAPAITVTSSANPVIAGQPVTLTAQLPAGAAGTVSFYDGTTCLESGVALSASPNEALQLGSSYGNGYVQIRNMDMPSFTFSAWVKLASLSGGQQYLIAAENSGGWGVGFNSAGAIVLSSIGGSSSGACTTKISDTNWHQVTVSCNGSSVSYYLDGTLVNSVLYAISPSSNGSYDLGSEKGQSTLNGQLAQVQIYNRVLSASEISYLYAGGLGILGTSSPSGLVAGYQLDGSLDDFSGYGYTGTQENSLSWTTTNPCEAYVASVPVSTDPSGNETGLSSVSGNAITAVYEPTTTNYVSSTSQPIQVLVLATNLPNFVHNYGTTLDNSPVDQATPSPLTDGSLVLTQADAGLTYISGSNGQPIVTADCLLHPSNGNANLSSVTATLYVNGNSVGESYYTAHDLALNAADGTDMYRFAVPVTDALQTGQYAWTMTIQEKYDDDSYTVVSPAPTGTTNVLNLSQSPYGADWWVTDSTTCCQPAVVRPSSRATARWLTSPVAAAAEPTPVSPARLP